MPVMDRGLVDVVLVNRRRISAKEGNRGVVLCRFERGGLLAVATLRSRDGAGDGEGAGGGGVIWSGAWERICEVSTRTYKGLAPSAG